MEVPTLHILLNILFGLTTVIGVITALAFTFNKTTRIFGVFLGIAFVAASISQSITQGYSDFKHAPYWWLLLIVAGTCLLIAGWLYTKIHNASLFNKEFWQQWKRAFWILFGAVLVVGVVKSLF